MRLPHRKDNKSPFRPPDNSPFRQHFTRGSLLCNEQGKYTGFSYGCQLFFPKKRGRPCAGGGRALPCTCHFFEKKWSKSFIPLRRGTGAPISLFACCPRPPKGRRAGAVSCGVFDECFKCFYFWRWRCSSRCINVKSFMRALTSPLKNSRNIFCRLLSRMGL